MKIQFDDLDNLFSTTLSAPVSDSDLTIYLNAVPTNATEGFVILDAGDSSKREAIYFNAVGANYVTCPASGGRGQAGTSAQSHALGAVVKMNIMREHIKPIRDSIFSGFIELNYSPAYASASTITISTDLTTVFTAGRKLRLTFASSGVRHFTILSSSVGGGTTTITLYGDAVANEVISKIEMDVNPQAYSENDVMILNEKSAAPGTPASGKGYFYAKDDGKPYFKNDDGTESVFGDLTAQLVENNPILLPTSLSADGKYAGIVEAGTAGAALAFGDLCYFQASDSRWELVDANLSAGYDKKLGICVLAAVGDGSATKMLLYGKVRADAAFPTLTIGSPVYISETAGDIVVAQPTTADVCIRKIGFGNTADELFFCPENSYITHV